MSHLIRLVSHYLRLLQGAANNVVWDKSDNALEFADDAKAIFGTGSDLSIHHDGSNNYINASAGSLFIRGSDLILEDSGGNDYITCSDGGAGGTVTLKHLGNAKIQTSATGATVTGTLVADGLTVDTDTLHVDATNNRVGIGTTSPSALLDCVNTGGAAEIICSSSTQPRLMLKTTGTTAECRIDFGDSGDSSRGAIGYNHSNDALKFYTTGVASERMRIDSSGRLLVGVTTARTMLSGYVPSLQVEGTANSDSSLAIVENISAASGPSIWFGKTRGGSLGDNTVVQDGDELGTIVFNGADGTDVQSMGGFIRASVDGTPGSNDMPGRITIHTTADGAASPTERMRIDSSGRLLLGTTTEGEASADNLTIADSGACGITIRSGTSNNGQIFFSDGTSGDDEYRGMIAYQHSSNQFVFKTNTTLALTLDSSQNATFAGTVSDSKGNLRSIPKNQQSSAYTLVASDAGKFIYATGNVTVPDDVFTAGDAITIVNENTGTDITITQGSGVTMYNAADASSGNRTLSGKGMATILFITVENCHISGAGLS